MTTITLPDGSTYHGVTSDVTHADGCREIEFAWAEIPSGRSYQAGPRGGPEIKRSSRRGAVSILSSKPRQHNDPQRAKD